MRGDGPDPEKGKILKVYKEFRGGMGVEVAPPENRHVFATRLLRPARQHDPRTLQRVALGPLIQHQRHPGIAKDVLCMQRQA